MNKRSKIAIDRFLGEINPKKLSNNTQRALFALLTAETEWVSRKDLRIPSVSTRLRELREPQFGFDIQCLRSGTIIGKTPSRSNSRNTFYRINPRTCTLKNVSKVFVKGVVAE